MNCHRFIYISSILPDDKKTSQVMVIITDECRTSLFFGEILLQITGKLFQINIDKRRLLIDQHYPPQQ